MNLDGLMFASEASQPTDSRRGLKESSNRKYDEAVMTQRQDFKEYDKDPLANIG